MHRPLLGLIALIALTCAPHICIAQQAIPKLRPPSVPLVTHDPYFSIWSGADKLTDDATRHWSRAKHSLVSLIRIDGKTYRLMGDEPKSTSPMEQTNVQVWPTRTIYDFKSPELAVTLTFMTPALPDDIEVLSRPLTYLTWDVRSLDGKNHDTSIYFSASSELAVHSTDQPVAWIGGAMGILSFERIGTDDQPVLERAGDDTRIDWGYAYVAGKVFEARQTVASNAKCLKEFIDNGKTASLDLHSPRAVRDDTPVIASVMYLGGVGAQPVSRMLMLAYDDEFSINYFGRRLRPFWRRNAASITSLLTFAARDYDRLKSRCKEFDEEFVRDIARTGGPKYAYLCSLAYRQCLAANKLCADPRGMPLLFPKENTSNGCIATVDVIYPMHPLFLLISPALAKASLATVLSYTASPEWKYPYAPHDLGVYPQATRQVYGGDDPAHEGDRMPVEESGNMILLLAAVAKMDGNVDFASKYWPQVTSWAKYLEAKGFDPENQLSTDDFTGHLAHNANLSVKAIEALAAYGMLCGMKGEAETAQKYHDLAVDMAAKWVKAADDGDHFRLAFDKPGTWSQKYNMVWDRILGLNVFPPDVMRKEMAFYLKTKDEYGLALDNRQPYAKLDWSIWTATMAETQLQWLALTDPIFDFLNHTPERNPITDLYWTKKGSEASMHARPVVGGVFITMLADSAMWKKWSARGAAVKGAWAPLPAPPVITEIMPDGRKEAAQWQYTFDRPSAKWFEASFDSSGWKTGLAPFGTTGTVGVSPKTEWKTGDIWLRREFVVPNARFRDLQFQVFHDEDIEIYINGVLAGRASGYNTNYVLLSLRQPAKNALKLSKNIIAAHCHQTTGGQGVDVGLVEVRGQ